MFDNINEDLSACSKRGNIFQKAKYIFFSYSFHMTVWYRLGCYVAKLPIFGDLLRVVIEYVINIIFASDLSLKSKIGPGLVFAHGHNIVIGGDVRIGRNCKIFNGVTLGNQDTESPINQQPTLGDNVVIGSGAKLLGPIKIGNNVIVGANSVVIKNFPSDVVIAGVPAKIIKMVNEGRENR